MRTRPEVLGEFQRLREQEGVPATTANGAPRTTRTAGEQPAQAVVRTVEILRHVQDRHHVQDLHHRAR
ncbi:hypothetical protein ABZ401_12920 [Streptomyces sp. NPDC005892]|uniref:hypothetical protein n=1 Tax=Streptomyces sp. NPDC005892 TaxID=3155593 RepID=UPI0033D1BB8B